MVRMLTKIKNLQRNRKPADLPTTFREGTFAPTTANILHKTLAAKGIKIEDIRAHNLTDLYASLDPTPDRPNFSMNDILLDQLPPGGQWKKNDFAVIIETRELEELKFVIENVSKKTSLPIQIFHGPNNRSILNSDIAKALIAEDKFLPVELNETQLNASTYNAIFLDQRFYNSLAGRGHFLVFQTDALCCSDSDFVLENFLAFDYVGALWDRERPIGLRLDGGCGGFSLRDWTASTNALERFSAEFWPGGEDGYFAFHLDLMGFRVANPKVMAQFGTQTAFHYKSFGAHKIRALNENDHIHFLDYCPEARNILSWKRT